MTISLSYYLQERLYQRYEQTQATSEDKRQAIISSKRILLMAHVETTVARFFENIALRCNFISIESFARNYRISAEQSALEVNFYLVFLSNTLPFCPQSALSIEVPTPLEHEAQIQSFTAAAMHKGYNEIPEFFLASPQPQANLREQKSQGQRDLRSKQLHAFQKMARYTTFLEIRQGLENLPRDRTAYIKQPCYVNQIDNPLTLLRRDLMGLPAKWQQILLTKLLSQTLNNEAMQHIPQEKKQIIERLRAAITDLAEASFNSKNEAIWRNVFLETSFSVVTQIHH